MNILKLKLWRLNASNICRFNKHITSTKTHNLNQCFLFGTNNSEFKNKTIAEIMEARDKNASLNNSDAFIIKNSKSLFTALLSVTSLYYEAHILCGFLGILSLYYFLKNTNNIFKMFNEVEEEFINRKNSQINNALE